MILVDVSIKYNGPCPWDIFVEDVDRSWPSVRQAGGSWRDYLDKQLTEMGGTNLMDTAYIQFVDGSDALAFILKYGGVYKDVDSLPVTEPY